MEGVVPTMPPRHLPNVLITGTPGVGKTTLARSVVEMLASEHALTHIDVTALCLEKNLTDGFDSEVRFVSAERPRRLNRRAARCSAAAACCVAVAAVLNRRSFGLQRSHLVLRSLFQNPAARYGNPRRGQSLRQTRGAHVSRRRRCRLSLVRVLPGALVRRRHLLAHRQHRSWLPLEGAVRGTRRRG